jgi:hypothetical protein
LLFQYYTARVEAPCPPVVSSAKGEEVVADGVADDDEWAPSECPDEIATAEVDQVKAKSIKRDIPFALRRGTISQVTTALDAAQCAAEDELALYVAGWDRYKQYLLTMPDSTSSRRTHNGTSRSSSSNRC